MVSTLILLSPMEQFRAIPLFDLHFLLFNLSITNITVGLGIFLAGSSISYFIFLSPLNNTPYAIPYGPQTIVEGIYAGCYQILQKNLNFKYYEHSLMPFIFSLALFLAILNIGGTIPMSLALTAQISVVGTLCLSIFFGIITFGLYYRGYTFFRTFYSPGTTPVVGMLLVPIEALSYCFKPISVFCRLFSNMMSGHAILKVIVGALTNLQISVCGGLYSSMLVGVLTSLIVPLFILEFMVGIIQAYVFVVIVCLFFKDTMGHFNRH